MLFFSVETMPSIAVASISRYSRFRRQVCPATCRRCSWQKGILSVLLAPSLHLLAVLWMRSFGHESLQLSHFKVMPRDCAPLLSAHKPLQPLISFSVLMICRSVPRFSLMIGMSHSGLSMKVDARLGGDGRDIPFYNNLPSCEMVILILDSADASTDANCDGD